MRNMNTITKGTIKVDAVEYLASEKTRIKLGMETDTKEGRQQFQIDLDTLVGLEDILEDIKMDRPLTDIGELTLAEGIVDKVTSLLQEPINSSEHPEGRSPITIGLEIQKYMNIYTQYIPNHEL